MSNLDETTNAREFRKLLHYPSARVWVRIQFDGVRLAISGVEAPTRKGDCESCGQIAIGHLDKRLAEVWARWHLNDMRANCVHQRQRGETWATHPDAVCVPTVDTY